MPGAPNIPEASAIAMRSAGMTQGARGGSAVAVGEINDPHAPNASMCLARVILPEDELMQEYKEFLAEDPGIEEEARNAARQMRNTPFDALDKRPLTLRRSVQSGKVGRRAPANPFHSPKLGKWRQAGTGGAKVDDPALQNNPLRGRLIVMIGVNSALLLVFIQALVYNRLQYGSFYASQRENSNIGPSGQTLFDMGGLNSNMIRGGEWIRLFWSMWMHSGWLHIGLNILCQLQYFYMLEPDWGTMRSLLLFWFAGMTGNLVSVICDPCKTTVGSSGGLFGLMGGVVPYCIEFWNSIPRPLCILIFSIVVLLVSLLTGLSKATDTWAHLGGLIGGLLFGFGTITTPSAFNTTEKPVKKQLRKNAVMRWLQQSINPECKCGLKEWGIRLGAWSVLSVIWIVCFVLLYVNYQYSPLGSLTYSGITKCCCCYSTAEHVRANWLCMECDAYAISGTRQTWGEFCTESTASARLLAGIDTMLNDEEAVTHPDYSAIDRAIAVLKQTSNDEQARSFPPDLLYKWS